MRDAARIQRRAHLGDIGLVHRALGLALLEVPDRSGRAGGQCRRQRRGEDEAGGKRPHEIDQVLRPGDVAAHHAEGLAQRALDHGQPVHQPLALGNAAAARAVHADRMHLVEIGHRAVLVGDVADFADRRDIAVHRIDALEGDQLRRRRIVPGSSAGRGRASHCA